MQVQIQDIELKESIRFLDANQKQTLLQYIKEQLISKQRKFIKREALRDIRAALKKKDF